MNTNPEQRLIGDVLTDYLHHGGGCMDTISHVPAEAFEDRRCATLWGALVSTYQQGGVIAPEPILKLSGVSADFLVDILKASGSGSTAEYHAGEVMDGWKRRRLAQSGKKLQNISGSIEDAINEVSMEIADVGASSSIKGLTGIRDDLADVYRMSEEAGKDSSVVGVPTGFRKLDRVIGGMEPGDITLLAARPKQGKSALAMNIATNVAKTGGVVAVFSLEMSRKQMVQRIISAEGKIDLRHIRTGELDANEWARYADTCGNVSKWSNNILLDARGRIQVSSVRSTLRRVTARRKVDLVVYDYIQLGTATNGRESQNVRVGEVSAGLKAVAMDFEVPVLALSQFNREMEKENRAPRMSDLRDSGSLEQDASVILFIHDGQLIVGANRSGPADVSIPMKLEGKYVNFEEV